MSNEFEKKYSDVVKGIEEDLSRHKPERGERVLGRRRRSLDPALWPHPSQVPGPSQRVPGRFF